MTASAYSIEHIPCTLTSNFDPESPSRYVPPTAQSFELSIVRRRGSVAGLPGSPRPSTSARASVPACRMLAIAVSSFDSAAGHSVGSAAMASGRAGGPDEAGETRAWRHGRLGERGRQLDGDESTCERGGSRRAAHGITRGSERRRGALKREQQRSQHSCWRMEYPTAGRRLPRAIFPGAGGRLGAGKTAAGGRRRQRRRFIGGQLWRAP